MSYYIELALGGMSEVFEHEFTPTSRPPRIEVADLNKVMDGISFGWSTPNGPWPWQPDPMTASLRVNITDFGAFDGVNGDLLSITVRQGPDPDVSGNDVIASFYGRASDLKAATRPGRGGVTVGSIGVDRTVDIGEQGPQDYGFAAFPVSDVVVLEYIMDAIGSTSIGSGYDLLGVPPRSIYAPQGPHDIRTMLNQLLSQGVKVGAGRAIYAPLLGIGPMVLTLDKVLSDLSGTPIVFPGSAAELNPLAWSSVKGAAPDFIYAPGWGNNSANIAKSSGGTGNVGASVPVTLELEADAVDVADFYVSPFDKWQTDRVVIGVDDQGLEIPVGLFPDWTLPAGDPGRSSCYYQPIRIEGVDPTRTPDGDDDINGILTGARININRGRTSLELTLRRPAP